jgi:hypothetical protein
MLIGLLVWGYSFGDVGTVRVFRRSLHSRSAIGVPAIAPIEAVPCV